LCDGSAGAALVDYRRGLRAGQPVRIRRIDAVAFCCNVHRGVVGGAEAGAGVTNYWLCDAGLAGDVAARDGTISLLLTSENSSGSPDAPILRAYVFAHGTMQ
jgi:hypothetical protein